MDESQNAGQALRRQAETALLKKTAESPEETRWTLDEQRARQIEQEMHKPDDLAALTPEEIRWTLHELRVHQIELEMQNEELRRAQAALESARARYFDLYDLAPVGYCTLSEPGLIVEANLAAATLLGVTRGALVRQPLSRFIVREDQDIYYLHRKRLIETGEPQSFELRLVKHDGTQYWAQLALAAAQDERGAAVLRLMLSDATERKRAEAARASMIIDVAIDAIISVDESERIAVFSAAAEKLFRLSAAEAKGQKIERFIPERFRAGHHVHMRRFIHSGASTRAMGQFTPISALRADGTEFPIEASISHVAAGGGHLVTVTLRDITAQKQAEIARVLLEAELREAHKMQAMGTLAGGIAHDFNNIIATILGNVELARQDMSADPLALQSLEEIRKAGSRARDLVQQILSFSRRQPTVHMPVSLAPIIEETARLLRATLPARVTLDVRCDADVPAVSADVTQIQQILINLATNAMQAMRDKPGRIGIRLDTVMLDAALVEAYPALRAMHAGRPGRAVRLAVSDDGPGMDAATLERIFEPFFTTKAVDEGTGLGLSVVHGIVQAHDGAIVVESQPGQGATFSLYLPGAEAEPGAPAAEQSTAATAATPDTARGGRILYLDDDEALVFLTQRLLERSGFSVSAHTDQSEALTALRDDPAGFDLVVTDYNMPGMSGLDVARAVRAIRADLAVAIASGFIDETLRAQAEDAGVRELIFKANAAEDLCEAVARLAQTVDPRDEGAAGA
jgi:PAS domain S-box-containing protein